MKLLCVIFYIFHMINNLYANTDVYYELEDAPKYFQQFKEKYNRTYKNQLDMLRHYDAFKRNLRIINIANLNNPEKPHNVTQFSDYTYEEVNRMLDKNNSLNM